MLLSPVHVAADSDWPDVDMDTKSGEETMYNSKLEIRGRKLEIRESVIQVN